MLKRCSANSCLTQSDVSICYSLCARLCATRVRTDRRRPTAAGSTGEERGLDIRSCHPQCDIASHIF